MLHGTLDMSSLAESIKVRGNESAVAKPSLMDRIKQGIGLKVEAAVQANMEKTTEEIDMLDEQGHI